MQRSPSRLLALLTMCAVLFLALGLVASADAAEKKFRAAILLPGKITDKSWNSVGHRGVMMIQEQLGWEVAYSEDVVPAAQIETYRDYAAQGYDLVMGHGGQYEDGAIEVAQEFPDTKFAVILGQAKNGSNVASYTISQEEAHYPLGIVAGMLTKSNKLGYVTGMRITNSSRALYGFQQGAKSVNANIEIFEAFTGDFDDVTKAKEAAVAQIANGADVLMGYLNAGQLGVVEAAKEKGVRYVAPVADLQSQAPETVVVSLPWEIPSVILQAAKDVEAGNFKGEVRLLRYTDLPIAKFGTFMPGTPEDVIAKANQSIDDITSGKVKVEDLPASE